ncbi:MAG: PrsW family intramembrane metalloprotease [Treponema sp.]|nr:PrsW family intramembrane metalloprotease [Treponema sp.]
MNIYVPILVCFSFFILVFILLALRVPGLKVSHQLVATLFGLLSVFPIAFLEYIILSLPVFTSHTYMSVIVTALIFNGLVEETLKMVFMLPLPHKTIKLPAFFSLCLLSGLIIGSFESVIYFLHHIQTAGINIVESAYTLILTRMGTSVLIHAFCSALSGLYIWSYHNKQTHIAPFVHAVLLHGLYDFFAAFSTNYRYFAFAVLLFAIVQCRTTYTKFTETKK